MDVNVYNSTAMQTGTHATEGTVLVDGKLQLHKECHEGHIECVVGLALRMGTAGHDLQQATHTMLLEG